MSAGYDEPISYSLTEAGWATADFPEFGRLVTTREAAALAGWTRGHIQNLITAGKVEAVMVGRVWLVDGGSLQAYVGRPRWTHDRLAAEPLLQQVATRGGARACGVAPGSAEEKALERAKTDGTLTLRAADRLAVRLLGLTLWDLWGEAGHQ